MLNIVIPARKEYPHLVWTVYSIVEDIRGKMPFHVTVYSNGGDGETQNLDKWFNAGLLARRGYLTVISEVEALQPYAAIQKASESFTDGLLMFCCGHIAVQRDTVFQLAKLAEETEGYCHSPMLYMGDYPDPTGTRKLYGYKDPVNRGWSWNRVSEKPYMWSGGGGGLTCVSLKTWRTVKGAEIPLRQGIGGVEEYLDMKMWMLGKSVWIHPDCLYFHWAKSRGYTWRMHEHYWNQLVAYYCLAGREYMEQRNSKFSYPQSSEVLDEIEDLCLEHHEWLISHAKQSLQEVLDKKPWLKVADVKLCESKAG